MHLYLYCLNEKSAKGNEHWNTKFKYTVCFEVVLKNNDAIDLLDR